jgi:energy-coupling factor transporter ATP-binding protein EcfA2
VQWLAIELLLDARARLVEGGAGGETRIDLAQVFVDLPTDIWCGRDRSSKRGHVVQSICLDPQGGHEESLFWTGSPRVLIIGGPGSGKTTATTMISQLLRLQQIRERISELPALLQERVRQIAGGLDEVRTRLEVVACRDLLPLRVNLPVLSRWMASRDQDDPTRLLWRFLADQATAHAAERGLELDLPAIDLETIARSHDSLIWIFDGLDEVPRSAGRARVVAAIHAAVPQSTTHGVVVTTRPQGYEGEFGHLDSLVLTELSPELALDYGRRLLRAWSDGENPQIGEHLQSLETELEKPEVQALVRSPLHATMATLLVAEQGTLPYARHLLFKHYFETIFKRELSKKGDHAIRREDELRLMTLHERAGLVLHTRSQERAGTRPALTLRELRALLVGILTEEEQTAEDAQMLAERILRFAADRLVLLLRIAEGGYAFGIRSLQEFFAGIAILEGESTVVRRRLEVIALNPHWANVLGLIVSNLAVSSRDEPARAKAVMCTSELCSALNRGSPGGPSAAACVAGSRLAIAMLRETERYGVPWLQNPLWEVALVAISSPLQLSSSKAALVWRGESHSNYWDDAPEVHAQLSALAVTWQGPQPATWLQRILNAVQTQLQANQRSKTSWLLLLPLLKSEKAQAVQIANEYAPNTRELSQWLLELSFNWRVNICTPWIIQFANEHAAWFPPGWIISSALQPGTQWPRSGTFAPLAVSRDSSSNLKLKLSLSESFTIWIPTIEGSSATWSHLIGPTIADSPEWQAWHKLIAFHTNPTKERLAEALEAAAEPEAWEDLQSLLYFVAWPVSSCLQFVNDAAELRTLATTVREGKLGDLEDWKAAEVRWRDNPQISSNEIDEVLRAHEFPWSSDIAKQGRVFPFEGTGHIDKLDSFLLGEIARVCRSFLHDHSYRRGPVSWLHLLLLYRAHVTNSAAIATNLVPPEIAERAPALPDVFPYNVFFSVDLLCPDLANSPAEHWFRLLDERGQRGWNRAATSWWHEAHTERLSVILGRLLARLSAQPEQWGLTDAIWAVLISLPTGSLTGLNLPTLPSEAPAYVRASAAALALLGLEVAPAELPALLTSLISKSDQLDLRPQLAAILARRNNDRERATGLLLQMLDVTTDDDDELRDAILGGLFRHLKLSALPAYDTAVSWKEHGMPTPYLSGQPPELLPPRLLRIELSNIRLFKDAPVIDEPFPIPEPDRGQWIVLVGENGTGKTTLLRALGLALADPAVAPRLLDENQPFVRNGGEGHITVDLDIGRFEVAVKREARTESITSTPTGDQPARPWIVGYGVRRGNARGEKDRAPEPGPTGELHTLFDRPAALINAVTWLLDLDRLVLNERRQYGPESGEGGSRPYAAVWQAVEFALKKLLKIEKLEPEERHVMVQHSYFGRVRLDALSDGYLTTTGWVIDLIARWIQRQEDLREAVGGDLLRQMTGLVLIDEIDLHLHPIWQMRIIDDVRGLFPRLSFVVTTHNPLTLQGARPGEIFIMRRRDGERIELVQQDIRPGHDVDRVLLEQFRIKYTFDKETRGLIEQHRTLLETGAGPSNARRLELEQQLANRLGLVGEVLVDERAGHHAPAQPWSDEDRRLIEQYKKPRN